MEENEKGGDVMIFPNFLKDDDVVGVTACSCGILQKIDKYEKTIKHFFKQHLSILETPNVRTNGIVSSDAMTRWKELKSLYLNDNVSLIQIASGGDFLFEMLPYVDLDVIKNHVKWIAGSSDPTSLLYMITTQLDIATIYSPCNMSGMDMKALPLYCEHYFSIIKGDLVFQHTFSSYEGDNHLTYQNEWISYQGDFQVQGRLIGGCLDCLKDIIGTKFDGTKKFIKKYKEEGIIWYFDVFHLSSESLYNTLLQFLNAGYFEGSKAILISKVSYPEQFSISYEDVLKRLDLSIPVVFQFDVGHVKPSFTMINGAKVEINIQGNGGGMRYLH